jgi:glycine hydroxymethyltransferase
VKKVDRLYIDQLKVSDPEIFAFITRETARQLEGINMIASENYASLAVLGALGSPLTNKYSEGLPGRRYYSGTEHIDSIERICQERALRAFGLDDMRNGGPWAVNVQAYSGMPPSLFVVKYETAFIRNGVLNRKHRELCGVYGFAS